MYDIQPPSCQCPTPVCQDIDALHNTPAAYTSLRSHKTRPILPETPRRAPDETRSIVGPKGAEVGQTRQRQLPTFSYQVGASGAERSTPARPRWSGSLASLVESVLPSSISSIYSNLNRNKMVLEYFDLELVRKPFKDLDYYNRNY